MLIVYDDLCKHAVAYRALSLLIRRPPGTRGLPRRRVLPAQPPAGARCAAWTPRYGGGSMTALPIIETQAGGRVGLHPHQRHLHHRRADLPGDRAVPRRRHAGGGPRYLRQPRVGGSAQTKAMKTGRRQPRSCCTRQYRELQGFAQFGSDLDQPTPRRGWPRASASWRCSSRTATPSRRRWRTRCASSTPWSTWLSSRPCGGQRRGAPIEDGAATSDMAAQGLSDVLEAIRSTGELAKRRPRRPFKRGPGRRYAEDFSQKQKVSKEVSLHGRASMKDIKLRIRRGGEHHADHQGHGAGGVLQAAPGARSSVEPGAGRISRASAPRPWRPQWPAATRALRSLRDSVPRQVNGAAAAMRHRGRPRPGGRLQSPTCPQLALSAPMPRARDS